MKLHLLGGPGSGKSFIAQHLSERFGVPALDLDDIYWDHAARDFGTKADPEKRDAALATFIARDDWIVEGAYYRWLTPSFQSAERIFVLTPPRWLRHTRIIRRFCRRKLGLDRSRKETFRGQLQLLAWNHRYDGDNLVRAATMLADLGLSSIRCASLADVRRHLEPH